MPPGVDGTRLREAWEALLRGAPLPAETLAGELERGASPAWAAALRAHQWLADPVRGRLPELATLAGWVATEPAAVASACAALARRAVLACDAAALDEVIALHRRVADALPLSLDAALLWRGLERGEEDVGGAAAALGARAAKAGAAALVIEAAAVRALAALQADALAEAEALARQASRMAQSEAMPQSEYLAHLVLARVRRATGRPHLAIRIIAALGRVVPAPWRFWLSWERTFAPTAEATPGGSGDEAPFGPLFQAAAAGDHDRFAAARRALAARVAGWRALADEAELVADALDPAVTPPPPLAPWCRGEVRSPPLGIDGLCLDEIGAAGDNVVAYVLVAPGKGARRFLRPGLALAARAADALTLPQMQRRQGRMDVALATLALGGETGMDEATFFKSVYGFAYVRRMHEAPLRVLVRRAGERIGDAAAIVRDGDRLALRPTRALSIPDPRCSPAVDYRVLRLVATHGEASSREAARELGIPLRTAQQALHELAASGVLRTVAAGQGNRYLVEDTTFSEPSRY